MWFRQSRPMSVRKGFLVGVLNGLLVLLFWGLMTSLGPMLKAELNYRLRGGLCGLLCSTCSTGQAETEAAFLNLNPPDLYFSIVIPKIDARAKIIPNVDASNPRQYRWALKKGVAHAKGTVFPGMKGTIYLFAHSAGTPGEIAHYNAVFYLLKELKAGDLIVVFFQGQGFAYQVEEKKIVEASETGFFEQKDEELLVLQTCHPPGTTTKALLVFAKRL